MNLTDFNFDICNWKILCISLAVFDQQNRPIKWREAEETRAAISWEIRRIRVKISQRISAEMGVKEQNSGNQMVKYGTGQFPKRVANLK